MTSTESGLYSKHYTSIEAGLYALLPHALTSIESGLYTKRRSFAHVLHYINVQSNAQQTFKLRGGQTQWPMPVIPVLCEEEAEGTLELRNSRLA